MGNIEVLVSNKLTVKNNIYNHKLRTQLGGGGRGCWLLLNFVHCLFVFGIRTYKLKHFKVVLNFVVYGTEILSLIRAGTGDLLFSKAARPALQGVQRLIQWLPVLKRPDLNLTLSVFIFWG
jgi:hypothetical protein